MAGMIGVLALMGLSPGHRIELWTSVLVTTGFALSWWITQQRRVRLAS